MIFESATITIYSMLPTLMQRADCPLVISLHFDFLRFITSSNLNVFFGRDTCQVMSWWSLNRLKLSIYAQVSHWIGLRFLLNSLVFRVWSFRSHLLLKRLWHYKIVLLFKIYWLGILLFHISLRIFIHIHRRVISFSLSCIAYLMIDFRCVISRWFDFWELPWDNYPGINNTAIDRVSTALHYDGGKLLINTPHHRAILSFVYYQWFAILVYRECTIISQCLRLATSPCLDHQFCLVMNINGLVAVWILTWISHIETRIGCFIAVLILLMAMYPIVTNLGTESCSGRWIVVVVANLTSSVL